MADNKMVNFITNFMFRVQNYKLIFNYANMYILIILAYSDNFMYFIWLFDYLSVRFASVLEWYTFKLESGTLLN
jgi:hypothetical protein